MADEPSVDLGIAGLGSAVRIGSGGFADVYRAQQTNLRREVAVKVLRAAAGDEQARMRFERECHAVGAVSGHPNIVAVHEGGFTADGRAYLVMEYFPGGSLADRLVNGPMSATEVIDIGLKIGRALGVAHDAGVLHRDVKPANILVSAYGEPALADFGIARVEGAQQTATGMVTASIAHASPEVLESGAPSAASDIYSLASTLFELFTGNPPHFRPGEDSVWAMMNRVVSQPVPDPASVGMPEPLASTVRRGSMRQPSERQSRADEFVQQLSGAPPSTSGSSTASVIPPSGDPTLAAPPHPNDPQLGRTSSMPGIDPQAGQPPAAAAFVDDTSRTAVQGFGTPVVQPQQVQPQHVQPQHVQPPVHTPAANAPGVHTPGVHPPAVLPATPKKRGRGLFGLVALLLVAGLGVGGWFLFQNTSGDPAPLDFDFPAASSGPLDAGVSYDLAVSGADPDVAFRLVVDGEPLGSAESTLAPFVPEAGRHSVAIEVTDGDDVRVSEAIETYVIGELPDPGVRANLGSVTADPANWAAALNRFDELVAAGHTDLQLLPSDRFASLTPGFWNLFVPGFGDDVEAARGYCDEFGLAMPDDCFVSFFDPEA